VTFINKKIINKLCCPISKKSLFIKKNKLQTLDKKYSYLISDIGVPIFARDLLSTDSERQKIHYDKVAQGYINNLNYPHTIEYTNYLNDEFRKKVDKKDLSNTLELCCGSGELTSVFPHHDIQGVGIDISLNMLSHAKVKNKNHKNFIYIQGDALSIPLKNKSIQSVFIFGGIHHVPNRGKLFSEINRVLKNNGKLYFREPVSDFIIWRAIRTIIYTLSPSLDFKTERPLLWSETVPLLKESGFKIEEWRTYGFIGFCFFMNSDILIVNRLFRFVPGIKCITRFFVKIDALFSKTKIFRYRGLQVIGVARKIK
jgi:ubiquinone/menaquinone biosynthesis C-methylase UbiE